MTTREKVELTVQVVGVAPRVVRSEDESVRNEAESVIDHRDIREGAVTGIVSDTEDGATNETLEPPIGTPESPFGGEHNPRIDLGCGQGISEGVDILSSLEKHRYCLVRWAHGS